MLFNINMYSSSGLGCNNSRFSLILLTNLVFPFQNIQKALNINDVEAWESVSYWSIQVF